MSHPAPENTVLHKSYLFAQRIVKLYKLLLNQKQPRALAEQILRSGTSIGANLEEATGGFSRRDFVASAVSKSVYSLAGAGCRLFAGCPLVVGAARSANERTAGEKPAARPSQAVHRLGNCSKCSIAYKEARETHYWLRLLRDTECLDSRLAESLLQNADELKRMLAAILLSARSGNAEAVG